MNKLLLASLLIAVTLAATAATYTCQIDHSAMYATGQTKTDAATGAILWEYKCPLGHTYWIAPMSPSASITTPPPPATPAQQPDYSYLHDAGKQQMEDAGRGLGQLLMQRTQAVHAVSVVLGVKCGHSAQFAMVTFSDGSTKKVDMKYEITDADRTNIAAVLPQVRIVDLVGCDE
jgi:hypothetical protein